MLASLRNIPRNHLLFYIANGVAALAFILLLVSFFSGGESEREHASQHGQRITVNLATGEMEGQMHQLFPDAEKDKNTTPADGEFDEQGAPEEAAPAPVEEAPQAQTSNDPFAEFTAHLEETIQAAEGNTPPPAERTEPTTEKMAKKAIPVFSQTVASLPAANQALTQTSPHGQLPSRGADGRTPFDFYSRPYTAEEGADTAKLALVITEIGANHSLANAALELPVTTSLVISPYAKEGSTWLQSARNYGQETWLQLPVEPSNFPASDPGPLGLLTSLEAPDLLARLHQNLARLQAYSGVVFPHDESFSNAAAPMRTVLDDLRGRGLRALISQPKNAANWAQRYGDVVLPAAKHIAPPYTKTSLMQMLEDAAQQARAKNRMILTLSPTPLAMATLKEWLPGLAGQGVSLVPLSAMAKK